MAAPRVAGVRAPLALATAPHAGQLPRAQQPHHGTAQRVRGQRVIPAYLHLVLGAAQLGGRRREPVPHLLGVAELEAVRELLAGRLDALEGNELIEVGLDHLVAQLDADRQVGRELDPRPRLHGAGVGQRQVRLAEDLLERADQVRLAHAKRGLAAAEEKLPALTRLAVG